jgi:hypothetical protein
MGGHFVLLLLCSPVKILQRILACTH